MSITVIWRSGGIRVGAVRAYLHSAALHRIIYVCMIRYRADNPVITISSGTAKQVCFTLSNYHQKHQQLVFLPIPGAST